MAIFDPNPQEVPIPDLRGYTKTVSQPEGNKALGTALAGVGQGLKDVGDITKDYFKLDDYLNKESARNATYAAVDPAQNAHIESLEGQFKALGGETGQGNTVLPKEDDITGNINDHPMPIAQLNQKLEGMRNARATTKAYNDLNYSADLMKLTKDLRAQYPGYRDYIDQQVRKASGQDPANYRVKALQEGIAALQANVDDPKKRTLALIQESANKGLDGMDKHFVAVSNGEPGAIEKAWSDIVRQNNSKYQDEAELRGYQLEQGRTKHNEFVTGKYIDNSVTRDVSDTLANFRTNYSLDDYNKMPQEVQGMKAVEAGQWLTAQINRIKAQSVAFGQSTQKDANGNDYKPAEAAGGAATYNSRVDANIKPLEDIRDKLVGKDFVAAHGAAAMVQARKDATANAITGDPKIGDTMLKMDYLKTFPEYARDFWNRAIVGDKSAVQGINDRLKGIAINTSLQIAAPKQPGDTPSASKDTVARVSQSPNLSPTEKSQLTEKILGNVKQITDPTVPLAIKQNIAKDFFTAYSNGTLNYIGNGRYSTYADFSDPTMVKAMKGLGGEYWTNYQAYMKTEFSETLFKNDLKSLKDIGQMDPRLELHWNSDTESYGLDLGKDKNINLKRNYLAPGADTAALTRSIAAVSPVINRLNSGINSYSHVLKESGGNVDSQLLATMKEAGFDINAPKPESFVDHMIKTIGTMVEKNNEANRKLVDQANEKRKKFLEGSQE